MVGDRNVQVTLAFTPYLMEFVSNPPCRTRMQVRLSETVLLLPTWAFI